MRVWKVGTINSSSRAAAAAHKPPPLRLLARSNLLTPQRIFSLVPRPNNNATTTCRSKHMCYLRSFRKSLSKVFLKRQRSKQLLCKTASRQST